jgi:Transposase DDE domain
MPRRRRTGRCRRPGKILAGAAAADAADDAAEGDNSQPVTPRALARRAERRGRLVRARDRLAAGARARREAQRAEQEARDAAAAAGTQGGRRPGDEPRANRAGTGPRADITDPDVRVMGNQKGYVAGYNGQAVVTAEQVIAAAMLSRHPVGRTLLHPLPGPCRDQLAAAGIRPGLRTVLADSGYLSEENFARADTGKLRLLAALAKDPGRPSSRPATRARHLDRYPATARAIRRMRHPRGREDCQLRARTVEPVFGQLKTCQELTTMSRRGFTACESEWLLACAAHNLPKLHRHRPEG